MSLICFVVPPLCFNVLCDCGTLYLCPNISCQQQDNTNAKQAQGSINRLRSVRRLCSHNASSFVVWPWAYVANSLPFALVTSRRQGLCSHAVPLLWAPPLPVCLCTIATRLYTKCFLCCPCCMPEKVGNNTAL